MACPPLRRRPCGSVHARLHADLALTAREVAALLRVSKRTVYMSCDQGRLAHVRVANAIRVESSALAAFVGAQRTAPR